jgi:prevent-host-death family protein
MTVSPAESNDASLPSLENLKGWKLEDAKARFSEVVRLARENAPQRITVRGEDAVVVLAARDFAKLLPLLEQPSLHALLSQSPLNRLEFESSQMQMPVRDMEL